MKKNKELLKKECFVAKDELVNFTDCKAISEQFFNLFKIEAFGIDEEQKKKIMAGLEMFLEWKLEAVEKQAFDLIGKDETVKAITYENLCRIFITPLEFK